MQLRRDPDLAVIAVVESHTSTRAVVPRMEEEDRPAIPDDITPGHVLYSGGDVSPPDPSVEAQALRTLAKRLREGLQAERERSERLRHERELQRTDSQSLVRSSPKTNDEQT
jgi:hypothetical protein